MDTVGFGGNLTLLRVGVSIGDIAAIRVEKSVPIKYPSQATPIATTSLPDHLQANAAGQKP